MAPNQNDVAREARVSRATVSRVISNHPLVSDATRRRVRMAMQRLGYTPNTLAQQLVRGRTDTICVVMSSIAPGFFADVMHGIGTAARRVGYVTTFVLGTLDDERRLIYRELVAGGRADGLIILEPWLPRERIAELEELGKPVVLVQEETESRRVSSVAVDNRGGGRSGMQHLLGRGYRDVLLVTGPPAAQDAYERCEGCDEAVRAAGVHCTVRRVNGEFMPDYALPQFTRFVRKNGMPRAVFAHNDAMAIAVLRELRRRSVRVPQEVAVMGFDGIEAAEYFDLTTVATPLFEIGEKSVDVLAAMLRDQSAGAQHVRLATSLTIRSST